MGKEKYGKTTSDYYIGLDVGTSSVGWAVTDTDYSVKKFKGNAMWGVRLFNEADNATTRRTVRTARRLNARKKQRLELFELLFSEEIGKIDPLFFTRLSESSLYDGDKTEKASKYSIFNDANFTDKDYLKAYPTVYHLRSELIHSDRPHDIRLVYLAIHHIMKSRGHFLFDIGSGDEYKDIYGIFDDLIFLLDERFGIDGIFTDNKKAIEILLAGDMNITAKKKELKALVVPASSEPDDDAPPIDNMTLANALAGAAVNFAALFNDKSLKSTEPKSFCLKNDLDESYEQFEEILGDRIDIITAMKGVYNSARLSQILGGSRYISDAKIKQFEENKKDLALLKKYVKENAPDKKYHIFTEKEKKLNNFAAYGQRSIKSGEYVCTREDFCKFLKKELPEMKSDASYAELYRKIEEGSLLPKLKGSDNSVIPNQLHLRELKKILENASAYLSFLNTADSDGITVKDKIIDIFSFRIPYYVGPLSQKSPNAWIVRKSDKIYPWNFEQTVDTKESAKGFMIKLIGKCTYTGDDVLPADSLLYSEFTVLNEINPIRVNGNPISTDEKRMIFEELFVKSSEKVTKKKIKALLLSRGELSAKDGTIEISGIDDTVKSRLKSYHDFKSILDKTHDRKTVEEIIRHILIFGDDKKMLKTWLKENCPSLDANDIKHVLRLKYRDWGRLSETFLTKVYSPDINGEAKSVIDMLRETNYNLMKLMSSDFSFAENANNYRCEKYGCTQSLGERIDEMYVAPPIKRSIRQTMKIVDEITETQKSAPKKIFIEVARGSTEEQKGKRTKSRKEKLLELYKNCKEDSGPLYDALAATDDEILRGDALYLYYTQFGKCMYTGEPIDIDKINTAYDIDHIFPRSKIKDDSIENKVLVKRQANIDKGNTYPIPDNVFYPSTRDNQKRFWKMLKDKELIGEKKLERLVRMSELSVDELSSFVSRQLVETQQSTKALAAILKDIFPNTRIVYSKAGNVSDFRHDFDIVKCREINDLHHAKDAYLNIIVGNVYDTKFTADFFKNIDNESYSLNKVFCFDVKGAWDATETIKKVKSVMSKNNILVTRMAYKNNGQLFDLQLMPKGKGQLEIKNGKPIEKYGGYNKLSGAYFCVVEHTEKEKRIRTIEPVFIYKKELYEADPVRYCTEILGLSEPKITYRKIPIDSLVELDGAKVYLSGRSGDHLLAKHSYQFVCDYESEKYIKAISKYLERCEKEKRELPVPVMYDRKTGKKIEVLTTEKNIMLYELFVKKLQKKVYSRLFPTVLKQCVDGKDKFAGLSLYEQCTALLQILKSFKCDRQVSDLKSIGGVSSAGTICPGRKISNNTSVYLICQSPTGLYETKIDLLKK